MLARLSILKNRVKPLAVIADDITDVREVFQAAFDFE